MLSIFGLTMEYADVDNDYVGFLEWSDESFSKMPEETLEHLELALNSYLKDHELNMPNIAYLIEKEKESPNGFIEDIQFWINMNDDSFGIRTYISDDSFMDEEDEDRLGKTLELIFQINYFQPNQRFTVLEANFYNSMDDI